MSADIALEATGNLSFGATFGKRFGDAAAGWLDTAVVATLLGIFILWELHFSA